jgi:predicted ATPase
MIEEPFKYITRVEIQGLWGRYDIVWNLNKDVNVLAGINGSGKTTILKILSLNLSELDSKVTGIFKLTFDNNSIFQQTPNLLPETSQKETVSSSGKRQVSVDFNFKILLSPYDATFINTFDTELKPSEAVQKLSDERVKTELDWELYQLQEKYKDYQINTARKKESVFKDNHGNSFIDEIVIEFRKLSYPRERLLDIIDELFLETNKKVNRDKNQLEFLLGDKEINAYQLSSGEKQLLVILLTVLVQDNKPAILLMDEPEISLHIEWQRKLIKYIRELNPNTQIIIATHSPAIIMEGWLDKVFNLEDLIVKDSIDATV